MQDRSERWRIPLLLGLVLIATLYLLSHRRQEGPSQEGWKIKFHKRAWKLQRDEEREVYVTPVGIEVYYTRWYQVGPFSVSKSDVLNPTPLGTNSLESGMVLYQREKELGRVLALEPKHKFEDGREREGVLVHAATGDVWMQRDALTNALVESRK